MNFFKTTDWHNNSIQAILVKIILFLSIIFLFLLAISSMSGCLGIVGGEFTNEIISTTSNPFIGLFIGIIATAVVQSSSATTSIIVIMVANGTLTNESAVFLIMGANIGTSVTSSIVSFGHITNKAEFSRAISTATIHDFFNILVTIILFPVEYFFGLLSSLSSQLADFLGPNTEEPAEVFNSSIKPISMWFVNMFESIPFIGLGLAVGMLFLAIRLLILYFRFAIVGETEQKIEKYVFSKPAFSFLWGIILTICVQSSSVTTSLIVPLVASKAIPFNRAFAFLMGANLGTTVTAILAALTVSKSALNIAFVHLLFNSIGVLMFFALPFMRQIPIYLSTQLSKLCAKNKYAGLIYVLGVFFIIPFILIYISKL